MNQNQLVLLKRSIVYFTKSGRPALVGRWIPADALPASHCKVPLRGLKLGRRWQGSSLSARKSGTEAGGLICEVRQRGWLRNMQSNGDTVAEVAC